MKKLAVLSMALVFMMSIFSLQAQETNCDTQEKKAGKYSIITLDVEMNCSSCAEKVTKQLAFTKGVKLVTTDVDKNTVIVKYKNTKTDSDKLIASLSEIGYKANIHKEKCAGSKKGCCPGKKHSGCKEQKVKTKE